MDRLDVYYRALRAYRGEASARHCEELRGAVSQADRQNDALTVSRNICRVDTDWMDAIEQGLPFVEGAIKQERQFIHASGEVLPIEKVKHVSKESVAHLARHSNLITKEKRDGGMIPDRLYSVEKQSDYAVYENRFLYMLLCLLRDFITVRYERISALSCRYDGALRLRKTVVTNGRTLTYSVDLREERRDDPFLRMENPAKRAIDRMDIMLRSVLSLLASPLMETAGKAPMLKPPITKTNVLKMDNNFKGAMALYEYVSAYGGDGYAVETQVRELSPFSDTLAEGLADACGMLSFLSYEYGLGLNEILERRFEESEDRARRERILSRERSLAQIKKRMEKGEGSPEEYILELENQLRLMQADNRRLLAQESRLAETEKREKDLRCELALLRERTEEESLLRAREKEALCAEYGEKLCRESALRESEAAALRADFENRLRESEQTYAQTLRAEQALRNAEREALERRLCGEEAARKSESSELRAALEKAVCERDRLCEQNLVCEARIKALRVLGGEKFGEDDFTEAEDFNELERELEAFVKFCGARWKITKKAIRKRLLSYEALKKKK